jgi:hypothetical protein
MPPVVKKPKQDIITMTTTPSLTFPWQLHSLLEAATREGFDHIVSWLDNNSSFKVHDPALFVKHVLPRFFQRQSKYKSFQRQLNIWQFERLNGSRGPCNGGYFHAFFHRYDTSLFHLMKRSKTSQSRLLQGKPHGADSLGEETIQHPSMFLKTSQPGAFQQDVYHKLSAVLFQQNFDTVHQVTPFTMDDHTETQHPSIVAREVLSLSSMSGILPNLHEVDEDTIATPKNSCRCQRENIHMSTSQKRRLSHYCLSPPLVGNSGFDDMARFLQSRNKSQEEDSTEGTPKCLSAEEWKYVLVGMQIACHSSSNQHPIKSLSLS